MSSKQSENSVEQVLASIKQKVDSEFGDTIVVPIYNDYEDYTHPHRNLCANLLKECDKLIELAADNNNLLITSNLLKAQISGNWRGNIKTGHEGAKRYYEKALSLLPIEDKTLEAMIYYRYGIFCGGSTKSGKEEGLQYLKKALELIEKDSPLYIECKETIDAVEKTGTEKKGGGGCFIATAVYESPTSIEVETLRDFRDEILLKSFLGRGFVHLYYFVSPPLATLIKGNELVKKGLKTYFFNPLLKKLK